MSRVESNIFFSSFFFEKVIIDAINVNVHARWAHRDRPNLSMLDVCQADTRDSLLLDIELSNYQSGAASGGKGPSYADRKKTDHFREVDKAKRLGR